MSIEIGVPIISARGLSFSYNPQVQHSVPALRGIDLDVYPGEYLAVIGHNGSGKSTLAKHFNALLRPTAGEMRVMGLDTREPANTLAVRRTVGMVFQVPDNQLVASVVEEDVAFGPENLGLPDKELHERVEWALALTGMAEYRHRQPHRLSAGQKQRVALAGVVAMRPKVLVLDEATSMLDPEGRREVLAVVRRLNDEGMTIVAITHSMDEAAMGDRVIVLELGRIVLEGTPRQVFSDVETLRTLQVGVPQVTELAFELNKRDPAFPPEALTVGEFVGAVEETMALRSRQASAGERGTFGQSPAVQAGQSLPSPAAAEPLLQVHNLHHAYLRGTPLETVSLRGVGLEVSRGEAVGIIGRAGSGKSTLVQHLNGLLRPREPGRVQVAGHDLSNLGVDVRRIRQKVGLVFQYPEQQLFERLVGDDIAFGLKKLGMPRAQRRERVCWAMTAVGLDFETFKDRYTFSLSGGEMRKAALAGVLALRPEVLILDESTSGLDPRSRRELLDRLLVLNREEGLTLVFVSPSMEDVAELVGRVYVLDDGRVALSGPVREVFAQEVALRRHGLGVPQIGEVAHRLRQRGIAVEGEPLTVAEGVEAIWKTLSS
ncbi:MAG: energy-coupling factor transporter ATPase [Anaerolineae bacterium]|nr:energy-coupling factor transporter ATPase [Anaerolineae bacterium]